MDISLRHAEPQDFEAVRQIYTYPIVVAGTLQIPYPSAELWKKRLSEPPSNARILVAIAEGQLVGHLSLEPTNRPRRAHVAMLGIAVRDDFQHRGVGSSLLDAAVSLADNWLNVVRIELSIFADNDAALHLYRRFGFVVEGTHRAFALRNGIYVDALSMARFHPKPPQLSLNHGA